MIMNQNKALWEKGDFTKIAETMRESGSALIDTIGVNRSHKVMDLGCGDGTTALPAARQGAEVLGVDIASNLVAAGNERAKKENLDNCTFIEGDASDLHEHADNSFDLVLSIFGAMFAPNPFDVAREMVRVARPGGRVVMGNWIPGDPTLVAQILKICASHTPPPPEGFVSPVTWGIKENVIERFTNAGVQLDNIECVQDTFTFRANRSPTDFMHDFKDYYGPTMNAFAAAAANGKAEELERELDDLFNSQNQSHEQGVMSIPATFLRVTARV